MIKTFRFRARLFLVSFGIVAMNIAFAQVFISGKVIDSTTKKGVAYANLVGGNTAFGTASDQHGNFFLRIENDQVREKLKISCIGYMNLFLSIDSLKNIGDEKIEIPLTPHIRLLDEVIIRERSLNPAQLVKDAIDEIPNNYYQSPFNVEFYSKIGVTDTIRIHYEVETILLVYRNGYTPGSFNNSKVTQKRVTGDSPLRPWDYGKNRRGYFPYFPAFNIRLIDMLGAGPKTGWTVFNPSIFKKLTFSFHGFTVFDGDTVSIVRYSTKKTDAKRPLEDSHGKYVGTLYIDVTNLAIIRHTLGIGKNSLEIIYKKYGKEYYPHVIKSRSPVVGQSEFTLTQEVFLRSVKKDNVETIEHKEDNWYPEEVPYNKEYWDTHYPKRKNIP